MTATNDSVPAGVAVNDIPFRVSHEDERQYRVITLPNRLRCIIVSDPDTDKEAAALEVGVGHFSDPDELPGLAHFLEHMLFLGTVKYPDENSFSSFLSLHCGNSNAYTSSENTLYHFELNKGHLHEALDRFAQFFIGPLFNESATERELKAVDNEHQKNSQNDMWRSYQLMKTTGNAKSTPFTKFGTGNYETLCEIPQKLGINTRSALLKFHRDYYSANMMSLCVIGSESLDSLQKSIEQCFSEIENRSVVEPYFSGPAFDETSLAKLYHRVPVKDKHSLHITWEFPATEKLYRVNPAGFIAHLLGHESGGSILSALKDSSWATGFSAGECLLATGFTLFAVTAELSPEGFNHIDEIVGIVFQYIRLLRAADSESLSLLYSEKQKIGDMKFRFKGKERPGSYCTELARNLHKVELEDVLSAHYLYQQFNERLIRSFIDCLLPERARFEIEGQKFADICKLSEKWYGTAYNVQRLPTSMKSFTSIDVLQAGILHLPAPNTFIASNFDVKSAVRESSGFDEAPSLLQDQVQLQLWFRKDSIFGKPKLNVSAEFISSDAYSSPRASILCQLFTRLLIENLNEFAYNAEIAGLAYTLDPKPSGIELHIQGYNEKLHVLLANIVNQMANPKFDVARFELVRESIERALINFAMEQPYQHSFYHQALAVELPKWSTDQRLMELKSASLEDVFSFSRVLLRRGRWQVLVHGNADEIDAHAISKVIATKVPFDIPIIIRPELRIVKLTPGLEAISVKSVANSEEANSSALIYFQIGPDEYKLRARLRLLAHFAQEPCFHTLRTTEQLGYLVYSGMQEQRGVLGFRVLVQSSEFSPLYLRERILLFCDSLRGIIEGMSEDEFKKSVSAVIAARLQKDKTLTEETKRIWAQLSRQRYEFDARAREAEELKSITKPDILCFYDRYLANDGSDMRRFCSLVFGAQHKLDIPNGMQCIESFENFKRSKELFPAFN